MNVSVKFMACLVLVSILAGAYIERNWVGQNKTEESETTKNRIITIIKERTTKDGTSKETKIIDRSTNTKDTQVQLSAPVPNDWMVYAGVNNERSYSLGVQRRILGPIFLGGFADTKSRYGVSVGLLF